MMDSQGMIDFFGVSKEYPRSGLALADVSFRLAKGEFAFLTGPSGAGKSTVLRLAYFDDTPSKGEVRVSGVTSKDVSRREIARLRRRLGIVFQDFRLLDDRSAESNVAFALEVTGTRRDQIAPRVNRALAQVGLAPKAKAMPGELSGGEQQRVAIARALVNDPFVLIADEPTGNLDDKATRSVFQLLRDINASGTAVLMATHNIELVKRTDYRCIELDHGRIVSDTTKARSAVRELS
jgi:cell division transport system ATP-binding protein